MAEETLGLSEEILSQLSDDTAEDEELSARPDRIVRHIMVIGFHHKHGYQVDYCYPPLQPGGAIFSTPNNSISLPPCWRTLPLLCLPDGSHNYDSDTIYFTMPDNNQSSESLEDNNHQLPNSIQNKGIKTIFGTACYRQIQADKLLNRTDDITRIAVQKSVAILSTKPLFGVIRSKLEMITHAYFEELDFSKVRILTLTYNNLNALLSRESVVENATFLGLSARQLVSHFGSNTLLLFKAMLLEKKILFYKSPVRELCTTIMSMCSIFTGLLEQGGLDYSACDLQLSADLLEALKLSSVQEQPHADSEQAEPSREDKVYFSNSRKEVVIVSDTPVKDENPGHSRIDHAQDHSPMREDGELRCSAKSPIAGNLSETNEYEIIPTDESQCVDDSSTDDEYGLDDPQASKLCRMNLEDSGLPLQIFTRGSFCLPYLSISYLDILADTRVKSFVIGATNFLFKQRKEMYDVIVDMEENSILINDSNLKRSLNLTTEDLRFMDNISRHVKLESNQPKDEFDLSSLDITNWVGGDEWIRFQFKLYTVYLLKASRGSQSDTAPFNSSFVRQWKQATHNYKIWEESGKCGLVDGLLPRHPFSSSSKGLNFNDMKLKLSYAVQSSERGKIINQTLNGIGKWSIWGNIASAAVAAGTSASSSITNALTISTRNHRSQGCLETNQEQTNQDNDINNII